MKRARVFIPGLVLMLATGVALAPAAYAAELAGTVFSASGQPVPSVWVVLTQGEEKGRFLTGDDGKYYIGNINPGDYQMQVKRGDAVLLRSTVHVPASGNHNLRLP
jgi:outer membrane usher protein FimD/PapC